MKRISGYITEELYSAIDSIAEKENRKFTPTISLLLHQAVKERLRKRNAKQKGSTEHNGTNMGTCNPE